MSSKVALAFDPEGLILKLDQLLPLRKITPTIKTSERYRRIFASLREVGLIEPLIVYPADGRKDQYIILDGALRHDGLRDLGETTALCLVSHDDETYTYNHKVSQIQPIQEHFMILKALDEGVPEERIARTLNIDVGTIRKKRNLLEGICPEAVELLRNTRIGGAALRELRRVVPMRQIEMAELMLAAHNFSASYAKCLYAGSRPDQVLEAEKPEDNHGLTPEELARIQREMEHMAQDYKLMQDTHGENMLHLIPAVGYLRTLLGSGRVVRYLHQHAPEILTEFQKIVASPELGDADPGVR